MKKVLGLISVLMIVLGFAASSDAATYLYANAANTSGGLRFDIPEGMVVDLSGSVNSSSAGTRAIVYADIFKGYWGLGIQATKPVTGDTVFDLSLQFAVEQPINENIVLGIGVPVVNINTGSPTTTTMLSAFSLYSVIKI